MTSQRALGSPWYNIRKQDTEYFTGTIVMMQFAKDAVDDDILVNNGGAHPFHVRRHLDEFQKAEIVSKRKLVPSVFIKTHYSINHR